MEGVPSSLILRNESWVRQHANALARRLPSNVERADLIQAGLIAVAQAALGFLWEGDRESEEAKAAFVRYARHRVHGAMLDELRQMDLLSRHRRRQVKLLQVARERWRSSHEGEPSAAELSPLCGLSVDEIYALEHEALQAQPLSSSAEADDEAAHPPHPAREAATPEDEVEARVDTAMLLRRLEGFFAQLPERDRQVIDAYLGVGLTPTQLAESLQLSTSRVSQMFKLVCQRIEEHLGTQGQRSTDRAAAALRGSVEELISSREAELAQAAAGQAWSCQLEKVLTLSGDELAAHYPADQPLVVDINTRWR